MAKQLYLPSVTLPSAMPRPYPFDETAIGEICKGWQVDALTPIEQDVMQRAVGCYKLQFKSGARRKELAELGARIAPYTDTLIAMLYAKGGSDISLLAGSRSYLVAVLGPLMSAGKDVASALADSTLLSDPIDRLVFLLAHLHLKRANELPNTIGRTQKKAERKRKKFSFGGLLHAISKELEGEPYGPSTFVRKCSEVWPSIYASFVRDKLIDSKTGRARPISRPQRMRTDGGA